MAVRSYGKEWYKLRCRLDEQSGERVRLIEGGIDSWLDW